MGNFKCTFTGVDEFTSLEEINRISKKYPFVEWGILLSTSEKKSFNGNRYPTLEWLFLNLPKLKDISDETNCSLALHVCGKETKLLLSQDKESIALQLLPFINRVQINFAYKNNQVQQLEELCSLFPHITFITQHNKNNEDLFTKVQSKNHQVLFDTSGGRGIKTEIWQEPLDNKICGYAGGLGLESIKEDFLKIKSVVESEFWIDMEGKIRTNDVFDLSLCEQILESISTLS